LLEVGLGVILPIVLLAFPRVRSSERGLVAAAFLAVLGFVMYRLNVSVTGMEQAAGTSYFPSWMEVIVSLGLVGLLFAVFGLAARYLPVFPEPEDEHSHLYGGSEEP
jgi:Ni/Fe-hydrogenase subunit HybB-like protein